MAADKLSTADVAQIAHSEGLEHAVREYLTSDRIADPQLAGLWEEAKDRLEQIQVILQPHYAD